LGIFLDNAVKVEEMVEADILRLKSFNLGDDVGKGRLFFAALGEGLPER